MGMKATCSYFLFLSPWHVPAYFRVVLALLLFSGGGWEGGLKSQGILDKNMTDSATCCYLMEQADVSVCITGNKIEGENLRCYI